jgi:hypothetical protein
MAVSEAVLKEKQLVSSKAEMMAEKLVFYLVAEMVEMLAVELVELLDSLLE